MVRREAFGRDTAGAGGGGEVREGGVGGGKEMVLCFRAVLSQVVVPARRATNSRPSSALVPTPTLLPSVLVVSQAYLWALPPSKHTGIPSGAWI
jgi:hypothetical protein